MRESIYIRALSMINTILSVCILLCALWIGVEPLVPEIAFRFGGNHYVMPPITKASETNITPDQQSLLNSTEANYNNTLIIPKIYLTTPIQELDRIEDLHTGSWLRPNTSTPEKGGNTVIVGHRYTSIGGYTENTFYHLPKLEIGDRVYADWNNHRYEYEVYSIKVVSPDDEEVEAPSAQNILTLYTCTPLWTSTERHVVVSRLISIDGIIAK